MNIKKLALPVVLDNLKKIGLIDEFGKPVSYNTWKNKSSIAKYSGGLKIVFVGFPNENLFGFYIDEPLDNEAMKESYAWFLKLVKGKFEPEMQIEWGDGELPKTYGNLRKSLIIKK
jgi:hypothetical protein